MSERHLWGTTEQQPAGVEVVAPAFGAIAAVHVVGARDGPLAVVQRLFRARHHLTQQRPAQNMGRNHAIHD